MPENREFGFATNRDIAPQQHTKAAFLAASFSEFSWLATWRESAAP
jgi:hypothetical protein